VADPEMLMTTAQAAKVLGISRRTLSRYAQEGQLTATLVLPSGHYRWALSDIRQQLQRLREQAVDDE
jgi:excisionase family DNA binding protein